MRTFKTLFIAAMLAIVGAVINITPDTASAAALTAARVTQSKNTGAIKVYLMKASTTIHAGGMVMLDSAGLAVPASALPGNKGVVGIAIESKTSASSGTYKIKTLEGWFLFAGSTLTQASQGGLVYAEDDQTVDNVPALNEPIAGMLVEYVSATAGWVWIAPEVTTLASAAALELGNVVAITDAYTLASSDCGRPITVSAGIDTKSITLPDAATVIGCVYKISYIGADGGALVDITPTDATNADGIDGGCTLAASVVNFSGTADADIGLTKATSQTGDYIELTAVADEQWVVTGCQGIWANN